MELKKIEPLLTEEQRAGKLNLFSRVTLLPGGKSLPHTHHGESEVYYIVSGEGEYHDDGSTYTVKAGDVTYCGDGHTHGIACTGTEPLVFIAVIINCK